MRVTWSRFATITTSSQDGRQATGRCFESTWLKSTEEGMTQTAEYRRLVRLASGYNTRARKIGAIGVVTADDLMFIELAEDSCNYCGIGLEVGMGSFDHIISLHLGGRNVRTNITRCCSTCQRSKFTKTASDFAEHSVLLVSCEVCGLKFKPRWGEYKRGAAKTCSRSCSAKKRWAKD